MRTANLRAKKIDGKWVDICNEEIPIHEQRPKFFNEFRAHRTHAEFALVKYQESDQPAIIHHFHNPPQIKQKTK